MTMQRTIKAYRLPDAPETPGFRKLTEKDCPQAFELLFNVRFYVVFFCCCCNLINIKRRNNIFDLKVFEKIRSCARLQSRRVQTLVHAARWYHRLVRGRTKRSDHRLWQFLSPTVDHHESSAVQDSKSGLFVLQRGHQNVAQRSHERYAYFSKTSIWRRFFKFKFSIHSLKQQM